MNYEQYLFSNLIKLYDENFALNPYDVQFDLIPQYYRHFVISEFNDNDKGLYECILDYCKHHFPNK
jgi:hypothetical protein